MTYRQESKAHLYMFLPLSQDYACKKLFSKNVARGSFHYAYFLLP